MDKAKFKYIEHELYCYDSSKRELQLLREEIIESGGGIRYDVERVAGGMPGKPTEEKVMKLCSSPAILHTERVIRAIDMALEMLGDNHRCLFNLRYRQRGNVTRVCSEIPCSEATFYRLRKELIYVVGKNCGLT